MPLLRANLSDFPNGYICLSTAERQSLASKAHRNGDTDKVKMGKKPDIMTLEKCNGKLVEFLYVESSRIVCSSTKKADNEIKLWRELLDRSSYIGSAYRSICNQFGRDPNHAEIPLTSEVGLYTKALIRLLLTLRNIIIVNKNLLKQAMEQAVSYPSQNNSPSPTVTTPEYDYQ
ncbi:hypothetical protein Glove_330g73 [Diversispora epigaea]|uniref:Uncharacterized protein n=1 Tax=Diversispora epigaea TaxID=1348612 RepID=A0A397HJN1_9GLOM|nr:hypothetical protein Glove_330g73 [Diversispora epigaea]